MSRLTKEKYLRIRNATVNIIKHLSAEDCNIQNDSDSSPLKWQLGHTTWFYEDFVLCKYLKGYNYYNKNWLQLFNSYYENKGDKLKKIYRNYYIKYVFMYSCIICIKKNIRRGNNVKAHSSYRPKIK